MGQNEELRKLAETGLDLDSLVPEVVVKYGGETYPIKYLTPIEEVQVQQSSKKLSRTIKKREAIDKQIEELAEGDDEKFAELLAESERWNTEIAKAFNEITSISIPTMKENMSDMPSVQMTAMSEFILKVMGAGRVPPPPENS